MLNYGETCAIMTFNFKSVQILPLTVTLCVVTSTIGYIRTHEAERTVLYKTKSLDGTKPNTNSKPKTKTNPKLTQILTLFSCFMLFSSTVP